jgi:hypothetical protein
VLRFRQLGAVIRVLPHQAAGVGQQRPGSRLVVVARDVEVSQDLEARLRREGGRQDDSYSTSNAALCNTSKSTGNRAVYFESAYSPRFKDPNPNTQSSSKLAGTDARLAL